MKSYIMRVAAQRGTRSGIMIMPFQALLGQKRTQGHYNLTHKVDTCKMSSFYYNSTNTHGGGLILG